MHVCGRVGFKLFPPILIKNHARYALVAHKIVQPHIHFGPEGVYDENIFCLFLVVI